MALGEILVRQGKVTREQMDAMLSRVEDSSDAHALGEALVAEGLIRDSDFVEALALDYGCDSVEVVSDEWLDPALITALPVEWARSRCMLPIRWKEGPAVLAADPARVHDLDYVSLLLQKDVAFVLAPKNEIAKAIERCYYRQTDTARDVLSSMADGSADLRDAKPGSDDLLRRADQAPVTQLVNAILLEALKADASDVHVEPFEKDLRVRYRIDGLLYEQTSPPKHLQAALVSRLKVMAHLDIAERRLPQDGTARVRVGEREVDIRVSTVPVAEGERVVLRLLNRESALLPLGDLGMPADVLTHFRNVIGEPNGIVLVTGPTGSGKTTTLYAALRELDTDHINVLTVEDPIEYQVPGIGQIQVKPKIGLTFAAGLRHILRQDPDVILVGETRDLETAEIAVRASLTGHLVFTTVHTNDAVGAAVRLIDLGIAPYLLSAALKACLAQRLIRKLCPACKKPSRISHEELRALGDSARGFRRDGAMSPAACPQCLGGYRGRTGLYEFLPMNDAVAECIRKGGGPHELRATAISQGMRTLLDDGVAKVSAGQTSISEILRAAGRS